MIFVVFVVTAVVAQFGNADEEQGLIPESFDSSRAAQFAAYAAVVVLVAPIVEELMFRGVGYALLEPFGQTAAILLTGLAFALVHGLVIGFPVIATVCARPRLPAGKNREHLSLHHPPRLVQRLRPRRWHRRS